MVDAAEPSEPGRERPRHEDREGRPPRTHAPCRPHACASRWCPDVAPCRMRDILTSIPPSHICRVPSDPRVRARVSRPLAAWLSQGTIAFTGDGDARVALLPLSVTAVADRRARGRRPSWRPGARGASLAPLWLLALLGAAVAPAVAARCASSSGPAAALDRVGGDRAVARGVRCALPGRPRSAGAPLTAGVLACAVYAVAAWQCRRRQSRAATSRTT